MQKGEIVMTEESTRVSDNMRFITLSFRYLY